MSVPEPEYVERLPHGRALITRRGDKDWLVTWLPDEGEGGWPGHTYANELPRGLNTLDDVLGWVLMQPWARRRHP